MQTEFFAPRFRVEVDGVPVQPDVLRHVLEIEVSTAPDRLDALTLTLLNPLPELRWTHGGDGGLFREGSAVKVALGYGDALEEVFDGDITALMPTFPESGAPTLTVEAFNRLHRLQARHDLVSLADATVGEAVRKVAQAAGLKAEVDDPGVRHARLTTGHRPHLAWLLQRARETHREVWVEGTTLHFAKRRAAGPPACTLTWGRTRERGAPGTVPLLSFTPTLDVRRQVSAVTVRGQDRLSPAPVIGRAGEGDEAPRLGGSTPGARVAAKALGGPVELVLVDAPVGSQPEAEELARAVYNERAMRFITGTGTSIGAPKVRAGVVATLTGVGRFDGDYYVTASRHVLGTGGYRTSFEVCRNAEG